MRSSFVTIGGRWRWVVVIVLFVSPFMIPEPAQRQVTAPRDLSAWLYQPFVWWADMIHNASDLMRSREELAMQRQSLMEENQMLYQWQTKALVLQAENEQLRAMLPFVGDNGQEEQWVLARIISDGGTVFTRSLLLAAGRDNGVTHHSMVRDHHGMMGYAVAVGDDVTQFLLITDISARVPVKMLSSNIHAILTGDNSPEPWLNFVERSEDEEFEQGDYIVTSGRGGVFPAGVAVGTLQLASQEDGTRLFRVRMVAEPHKARYAFVQVTSQETTP